MIIKESWVQRPEPACLSRIRHTLRGSTRTRAASLEKLQTGSIKSRASLVGEYQVDNTVGNEEDNEKSSWSDTENEVERENEKGGVLYHSGAKFENCKSKKYSNTSSRAGKMDFTVLQF